MTIDRATGSDRHPSPAEPRGDVLARVLDGLRGLSVLPAAATDLGDDESSEAPGRDAVPLPRRRR